jgi:hypothetical protein
MTEIPLDASFELGASKQVKTLAFLKNGKGKSFTAEETSSAIGAKEGAEMVFKFLEHPAAATSSTEFTNLSFSSAENLRRCDS